MAKRLLIDTDVIIDYLRGYPAAVEFLEQSAEELVMSVMTVAELYAGVREGEERVKLEQFLSAFEIVPIDREIAANGGIFRRNYKNSHNVGLADGLIAATAETMNARLVTLNKKHFPMLQDVFVPYRK